MLLQEFSINYTPPKNKQLLLNSLYNKFISVKQANPIIAFVVLFALLFALMYYGNLFFIGITTQGGGFYSPLLDEYFNYVKWFRSFLLHASSLLPAILGYESRVSDFHIYLTGGSYIKLVHTCLGLGLLSFWVAFVLSYPQSRKEKILYLLIGCGVIILLNIIRITALLLIYSKNGTAQYKDFDHHLYFNIGVYTIIFFMMKRWMDKPSITQQTNNTI